MLKILKKYTIFVLLLFIVFSCKKQTGTLIFKANGEDFVRQGFIDKNNWHITFNKLIINIVNPTSYSINDNNLNAELKGSFTVDLAEGDENAQPISIGKLESIPEGNYQSLKFDIKRINEGDNKGYSIIMVGTAKKDNLSIPFTIKLDEEMTFDGKEGYVGDELKGNVTAGQEADVEMTFHFDHIFGDIEAEALDHVNTGSVGFDFFYQFAENGVVNVSQDMMKNKAEYPTLVHAIWTLGHLGEGHCEVSNQTSKDIEK